VLLFLALGPVVAGCAAGDYGAAAGSSGPAAAKRTASAPARTVFSPPSADEFGGPMNVLPNGSFDAGTKPWSALGGVKRSERPELIVTKRPHRFGSTALLVQEGGSVPFGAQVTAISTPTRGSSWRFSGWVQTSRNLLGSTLVFQIYALSKRGGTVPVATFARRLSGRWRRVTSRWTRLSVLGRTRIASATSIGARVYAKGSAPLFGGWIALDGVTLKLARSRSGTAAY